MAGEGDNRSFTESEMQTLAAGIVQRETADLTAAKTALETEKAELETKLDVETAAKVAAEARASEAETALADFKASIESEREAAARKDERLTKVREVASHLGDDFFADQARIDRICAYTDEAFEGYVADLGATATKAGAKEEGVPRETAMAGAAVKGGAKTSAAEGFLLRGYEAPKEG